MKNKKSNKTNNCGILIKNIIREWLYLILLALLIWVLFSPNDKWPVSLILILMLLIFLSISTKETLNKFFERIEKIEFIGVFSLKTRIDDILQISLVNEVVTCNGDFYLIDENRNPQHLPDKNTALFFSSNKGIIPLEQNVFSKLNKPTDKPLPSIETAKIRYHNDDFFILYNEALFYQKSMAGIYNLAKLKGINNEQFRGKKDNGNGPKSWEFSKGMTHEEFMKSQIK